MFPRLRSHVQRIKGFVGLDDAQKTQLDRRAFLRGMSVTAAGLLVPSTSVFDLGRCHDLGRGGQVVVPILGPLGATWRYVHDEITVQDRSNLQDADWEGLMQTLFGPEAEVLGDRSVIVSVQSEGPLRFGVAG